MVLNINKLGFILFHNFPMKQTDIIKFNRPPLIQSRQACQFQPLYTIKAKPSMSKIGLLTNDDFKSLLVQSLSTNFPIIQSLKGLNSDNRSNLQKYCINNVDDLSLFLLYEIGWQLGLTQLSRLCNEELINENYEQLNYAKFDLVKCSFTTFRRILEEYNILVKSLDIQGLRQSDFKLIIDDYCLMCNIDLKEKENLYNQFISIKDNQKNKEYLQVRRSMIQMRKSDLFLPQTPQRYKNISFMTPKSEVKIAQRSRIDYFTKKQGQKKQLGQGSGIGLIKQVERMLTEQRKRKDEAYRQILELKNLAIQSRKNQKKMEVQLLRIGKSLNTLMDKVKGEKRIEQIKDEIQASFPEALTNNSRDIYFVFNF